MFRTDLFKAARRQESFETGLLPGGQIGLKGKALGLDRAKSALMRGLAGTQVGIRIRSECRRLCEPRTQQGSQHQPREHAGPPLEAS